MIYQLWYASSSSSYCCNFILCIKVQIKLLINHTRSDRGIGFYILLLFVTTLKIDQFAVHSAIRNWANKESHNWKERPKISTFTRFENDSWKIQGDTAFLKLQNLLRNAWDVGMRSRFTLTRYKLTKHSMKKMYCFWSAVSPWIFIRLFSNLADLLILWPSFQWC